MKAKVCHMSQPSHAQKTLKHFGMEQCTPRDTPMLSEPLPTKIDMEDEADEDWDMGEFVGLIGWLVLCTRPDMAQVHKILSRFIKPAQGKKQPGKKQVAFAKHALRFLRGTVRQGLTFRSSFPLFMQIFTDASHASCVDTRRSITSLVVKLGGNTVYWKTSFTSIVSHSSTESELMALDIGATMTQALRWLIQAIGGQVQDRIQIFVDNTSTITIASNPVQQGRNLHIHARYFYVRDLVYGGEVLVLHIPTGEQVADIGCTFKGGPTFLRLRRYLLDSARVVHDEQQIPHWEMLVQSDDQA